MTSLFAAVVSLSLATIALANPVNWKGDIDVMGQKLNVIVHVESADAAKLSIPAQNLDKAPLKDVKIDDTSMVFVLQVPPMTDASKASFTLTIDQAAGTATGVMKQAGMELPITLKRLAEGESTALVRPQDSLLDPSQYTSEDVTFVNPATKGTLAGTLTIPQSHFAKDNRHAAIVLISGSGPQDRDCTIMGHKPFRLLADTISRAGVAVLRVDDPGTGKSDKALGNNATSLDYAADVAAAVAYLRTRPEIDPARVGLIGHSEGGLIAPLVASKDPTIAFVALLAGPGVTGREVLERQLVAIMRAGGAPEADIESASLVQRDVLAILASDVSTEDAAKQIDDVLTKHNITNAAEREEYSNASITGKWMRWFLRHDPRGPLAQMKQPVLIANGELDTQVLVDQNVPEIQKALQTAGNTNVTTIIAPKLNHLFQPATTGGVGEYATIELTVDPAFLKQLTDWIVQQAKPAAK
jgi:hypothetical protein